MTQQLFNLIPRFLDETPEEMEVRFKKIRHRKYVERPSAKKKVKKKTQNRTVKKRVAAKKKLGSLLKTMNAEEKAALIEQLQKRK